MAATFGGTSTGANPDAQYTASDVKDSKQMTKELVTAILTTVPRAK